MVFFGNPEYNLAGNLIENILSAQLIWKDNLPDSRVHLTFFYDGTKVKIPSEIEPPLTLSRAMNQNQEAKLN